MIGNDVVDLATAKIESNWKRKGYLDKIYTSFELEVIKKASNPDEMVWMLWSVKESTYKAYQRIHYNRGFYPLKIEVRSIKHIGKHYISNIVLFGIHFHGKTVIENQVINTVVVHNEVDYNNVHIVENCVTYKDNTGLPFCKKTKKPVSISHHGSHKTIIRLS